MKETIKKIWRIIRYPLLYLAVQFLIAAIASIAIGVSAGVGAALEGKDVSADDIMNSISKLNISFVLLVSNTATIVLMLLFLRKEIKVESCWKSPGQTLAIPIALCALAGIAISLFTDGALYFTKLNELFPGYESVITNVLGKNFLLELLVVGILAPVSEEIIFRGAVLGALRKSSVKLAVALIIQSLLFALVHMNVVQGVSTFVFGIMLGIICIWTDSIWAPIIAHITHNSISVVLVHTLGDTDIPDNIFAVITVVSLAILVLLLAVLRRMLVAKPELQAQS